MRKNELLELAGDENHISGIYNYCDRWCERCSFTSRCFLYASEQADADLDDPEVRDIANEKFWRKLQSIFHNTADLIEEWAAENGVDLKSIDVATEMEERDRALIEAEQNELSQTAHRYASSVEDWFGKEFAAENAIAPSGDDVTIYDAAEVVRWYQFFIAVKLVRALTGAGETDEAEEEEEDDGDPTMDWLSNFESEDDKEVDYDAVLARTARMDRNGSAKVSLVAIDRSIAAWRALQISLPEKSESIKPMLIELVGLRSSVEARFPHARDFIRPGLDEAPTEFVS